MTDAISLTSNPYVTANPALIAENKYTQQLWKERYAYISMVAFTALAIVANYFLNPLVLPITLVYVNFGVLSLASNFVIPRVLEWFAEAKKLKAQGDKEMKIDVKLQQIREMGVGEISDLYGQNEIKSRYNTEMMQNRCEYPLLARAIYWKEQSDELTRKSGQLVVENKFREAMEAELSSMKAKLKAAFYSALIEAPNHPGKFKDSITWTERTAEEWALQRACVEIENRNVAQTKEARPKQFNQQELKWRPVGVLAQKILTEPNESSSDSDTSDSESETIG